MYTKLPASIKIFLRYKIIADNPRHEKHGILNWLLALHEERDYRLGSVGPPVAVYIFFILKAFISHEILKIFNSHLILLIIDVVERYLEYIKVKLQEKMFPFQLALGSIGSSLTG